MWLDRYRISRKWVFGSAPGYGRWYDGYYGVYKGGQAPRPIGPKSGDLLEGLIGPFLGLYSRGLLVLGLGFDLS